MRRRGTPVSREALYEEVPTDAVTDVAPRRGPSAQRYAYAAAGFAASGEAAVKHSQPLPRRDGPRAIEPPPDGPLHVRGSLEIVTGTGKTIKRTS
jgi:hypothetical protein